MLFVHYIEISQIAINARHCNQHIGGSQGDPPAGTPGSATAMQCYRYREALGVMVKYNKKKTIKYSLALYQCHGSSMQWQHLTVPLLSCVLCHLLSIVWSPHSYIPTHGQSLLVSCGAAGGVTEGCSYQVLLLTSPRWMEQKIPFLKHVNSFAICRFTPRITLESTQW